MSELNQEAQAGIPPVPSRSNSAWVWDGLLILVLLAGAYFRFTGLNWDAYTHLHPDERFLTMVSSALDPVKSLTDYFNTAVSSLNPNNRGYGFFVYGTLPILIVRYVAEWVHQAGYDDIHLVGRQLSALVDLLTVLVVYLIANRLYKKGPLSFLAAAFTAFEVLPIQQAHYFTVDTFTNLFGFLAFYFAARLLPNHALRTEERVKNGLIFTPPPAPIVEDERTAAFDLKDALAEPKTPTPSPYEHAFDWTFQYWETAIPYILFGVGLGMAVASKLNAAALAVLLPGAVLIRWLSLSHDERQRWAVVYLRNLLIAAVVSLIVFRIFQPYAFKGPGFFNMSLNPSWVNQIQEQRAQAEGDVDFPPALQWARRTIVWFPFQNLVIWGLGLPLGILAWAGFAWMAWRMLRGEWRQHLLVWGWTALYFAWQATSWNPTMRYLLLIYPSLAIIAAWAVVALWEKGKGAAHNGWETVAVGLGRAKALRIGAWLLGAGVLVLTILWAYAFLQIYERPLTRVAASDWIYQNVPGPINLKIDTAGGQVNEPLAFRAGFALSSQSPLVLAFKPELPSQLIEVNVAHIGSQTADLKTLGAIISTSPDPANMAAVGWVRDTFTPDNSDPRGRNYRFSMVAPLNLDPQQTYYLILSPQESTESLSVAGSVSLGLFTASGVQQQYLPEPVDALRAGQRYILNFELPQPETRIPVLSPFELLSAPQPKPGPMTGAVSEVTLPHIVDWEWQPQPKLLRLTLIDNTQAGKVIASADLQDPFSLKSVAGASTADPRGSPYTFTFSQPAAVSGDHQYTLSLEFVSGPGQVALYGSKQANESSWDDALPQPVEGYNPYDYSMGVFRSDLNFEMYWDDNQDKRERFISILDQADAIFISSNRQWGTTVRVPERYPMTTEYYRDLLGCPSDKEITWCYSVAQPGMFQGKLGFKLAEVFQSEPNLGPLTFNSQFAEEAFSVYDHPKVLIFTKTPEYNSAQVQSIFNSLDLSQVIHLTPRKASSFPGTLILPSDLLAIQRAGGTWAALFHTDALFNQYPGVGAVLWYLVIAVLGWVTFPFTRLALFGLPDRGFPLVRMVGMLLLAYFTWLAGSFRVSFTPLTISAVFLLIVVVNVVLAVTQREALAKELRERWRYYLMVEGLMLAFFLLFLMVRLGNPDLWHPYKGGEKPMDFSYFNAVLKSTVFPPYDPWFAGGYLNYYYFGFVLVGVPVKWLGIVPSIAYNLILPTLYGILAVSAFSIAFNLLESVRRRRLENGLETNSPYQSYKNLIGAAPFWGGVAALLGLEFLGNLGTLRMIWHGIQRLAPMGKTVFEQASLPTHLLWTVQGFAKLLGGATLPYPPGDWYWIPSRVYPGEPITEFPAFTFLYADPHAHLIALPVTLLALAWALSILLGKWGWKGWSHLAVSFFLGALAIGTLRPTNTWDWPTYLAIGSVSVLYTALRYGNACCLRLPFKPRVKRGVIAAAGIAALVVLSALLYQPYSNWYGQAYNALDLWNGAHSDVWSYLTHWGLFLFVIVSWLAWETVDWMASTPASSLRKLSPYKVWLSIAAAVLLILVAGLLVKGVEIAWIALPAAAWAGVLLFRPGQPDAKRAVLFMVGTGLVLTLFVEVAVLRGDIGRMNTVFKFYFQAWTLLAVSAGASLFWLLPALNRVWRSNWYPAWEVALMVLVMSAALFPITAGLDKINDRMAPQAPHTLDGMTYMQYAHYNQNNTDMDLSQDYNAIRWMQENVQGSPVIVEANTPEYMWGSRFTIYTGLPGVIGWNWHQRQQRAITPDTWVYNRIDDVTSFYKTVNLIEAQQFLHKYDVQYIVVGQLERSLYPPEGLAKFDQMNGKLWQQVYRQDDTVIYKVIH